MFTGLVQEIGEVVEVRPRNHHACITITAKAVSSELHPGDSVAVSGGCLTAVEVGQGRFSADLAKETLERTSLGHLEPGSLINLELPMRLQDRLGGHIVQGHAD